MSESTPYFLSITDKCAMRLDYDDLASLTGETISLETQSDLLEESVYHAIQENFPVFYKALGMLSADDQEIVLSYYLVHKPQWCLAKIKRSTQTDCSFRLRMAIRKLGACLMYGVPDEDTLSKVLSRFKLEHVIPESSTSHLVQSLKRLRSFKLVGSELGLSKTAVRKALTHVSKSLLDMENNIAQAIGAYIFGLLDCITQENPPSSMKKVVKSVGNQLRIDPPILGKFRINVESPDFKYILVSQANI